jgi:hypothetical protein
MGGRSSDFWQRVAEEMERHKQAEIENFGISINEDTGAGIEFSKGLHNSAQAKGFVLQNEKWRKTFGEVLEFCCFVDTGMRTTSTFQIPLLTEIVHKSAPGFVFLAPLADIIVPGFNYYHVYKSAESAILGIQAHIDLFDTIGELIVTQPRRAPD